MKPLGILIGLCLFVSGCVYKESPPKEIVLTDLTSTARSSLSDFSYDLNSRLLLPFLTAFGRNPSATNVIDETTNMVLLLPLVSGHPTSVVFQMFNESVRPADIRIQLNDAEIGGAMIDSGECRLQFKIELRHWDSYISSLRLSVSDGSGSVRVDNMWLLFDDSLNPEALEPGNRFTGFVLFPDEDEWIKSIFLPSETSITFPVQLPEPASYLHMSILTDETDARLDLSLVTARVFRSEPPVTTQIILHSIDDWTPIRWDVSERAGRHATIEVINRGQSAVLLQNLIIRSESPPDS